MLPRFTAAALLKDNADVIHHVHLLQSLGGDGDELFQQPHYSFYCSVKCVSEYHLLRFSCITYWFTFKGHVNIYRFNHTWLPLFLCLCKVVPLSLFDIHSLFTLTTVFYFILMLPDRRNFEIIFFLPQIRVQRRRSLPAGRTVLPPGHRDGERDL